MTNSLCTLPNCRRGTQIGAKKHDHTSRIPGPGLRNPLLVIFVLLSGLMTAQSLELNRAYPSVRDLDGRSLPLAWFGGLNAPQPQAADLDGDGTPDLYIFDKAGQISLGLRSEGSGDYRIDPALVEFFPEDLQEWILLRDYNQDGAIDLFTYAPAVDGIRVYRGARRADGRLSFTLVDFGDQLPQLYAPTGGNGDRAPIFISRDDYPAVVDEDRDGDLDILTFNVGGGYIEYYQNQAVERGFGPDTLIYRLVDNCWGGFFESGLTTALDLSPAPGECFDNLLEPGGGGRPRHSGSTIAAFDYDGNGLTDIMLGDISFDKLVLGLNNGSLDLAWIGDQDETWPSDGVVADIPAFPAAFHLDADQDGAKDIIGAPSVTLNVEDVNVMWYYRNVGTDEAPDFVFQDSQYLVRDMIDFGTSAFPAVLDYDADGRPDLVVGNNDDYTGTNFLSSQLRLFRNITPVGGPVAFELVDDDYLGLTRFMTTTWAFAPSFGDLDNDGDLDAVIGERSGKLIFIENTGGPGQPVAFGPPQFEWMDLDAGQFAKPHLADLDRDGLMDLLVGGFDGRIRFYRNVGTPTEPMFSADLQAPGNQIQLGTINVNTPGVSTGHPTPWVLQNDDYTLVFSGKRDGALASYRFGIDSVYSEPFTLLTKTVDGLDVGAFSAPCFADFNGDGVTELVVGNERGGLTFFGTNFTTVGTVGLFDPVRPAFEFSVFPNPAKEELLVSGWSAQDRVREIQLVDLQGRILRRSNAVGNFGLRQVQWTGLEQYPAGVYFIRAIGEKGVATRKLVLR
ncbi:T9SS type A sorting domain-containing protein [Lewinella sp. W8]|uniref:T9SS type A sorting domain-containing protein n=1 Tax=Lewinella sp. W8 TaxID=2528208 RepID=UPI0010684381|nr:T9SS type A sorting domain-containing protein [Lewinella sp. W8]MTB49645.1 T9SS type A sorting domain-containing protein [Lewinella sp. W8]